MFAHVLFASVVEIHGRHSYDPRVHCCAARLENRFDSIETSWEVGQDWAGIRGVLVPLVCVLSFPALSCGVPVLLPVVRMPLMPGALTAFLVFSIVRIVRHLLVLPTLSPRSLAGWHGAVSLVRYLRARYERLAAACAGPNSCHGVLPDETRGCFAVSPPFTGCLSCRSVKPDRCAILRRGNAKGFESARQSRRPSSQRRYWRSNLSTSSSTISRNCSNIRQFLYFGPQCLRPPTNRFNSVANRLVIAMCHRHVVERQISCVNTYS